MSVACGDEGCVYPEARDAFVAAAQYYDHAVPGLGDRFLVAVRRAIELAVAHPDVGSVRAGKARRLLVHGFPYDVVLQVEQGELQVLAVAHQHRKPGYWREWLSD